jgi:hypothetical protein
MSLKDSTFTPSASESISFIRSFLSFSFLLHSAALSAFSRSYSGKGVIYPLGTNNPNLTTALFFYVYVPPWATGQLSVAVKANTTAVGAELSQTPVYYNASSGLPIIAKMGSSFTFNVTLTPGIYVLLIMDNGLAPASAQFTANLSYTPSTNQ